MAVPLLFIVLFFVLMAAEACFTAKKILGYLAGVFLSLVVVAGFAWYVLSMRMPAKIEQTTRHPIKTITYPDGSKSQIFSVNGSQMNANNIWHRVIDEENEEVERVVPVTEYLGLSYGGTSSGMTVQYNLVKKAVK